LRFGYNLRDWRRGLSVYGVKRLYNIAVLQRRLYRNAEKVLDGYFLRVTGDVDIPSEFVSEHPCGSFAVLNDWVSLASELGTIAPIVYVTVESAELFERVKKQVHDANPKAVIGVHGIRHVKFSGAVDAEAQMRECRRYSDWWRFPYLDFSFGNLMAAKKIFGFDSSVTDGDMFPFRIGGLVEYPISTPTDTYFRGKPVSDKVVRTYLRIVEQNMSRGRACTLLFHPNRWTVELMKEMLKVVL